MIALRWRPEWFKCKSTLGYGRDWPIYFDELEPYYEEAEEALKISGPIATPGAGGASVTPIAHIR